MSETILVDDDQSRPRMMEYNLQQAGYAVTVACAGDEVMKLMPQVPPRFILTDLTTGWWSLLWRFPPCGSDLWIFPCWRVTSCCTGWKNSV